MSNKGQLIGKMAGKYGVDANKLFDILKQTAFKQKKEAPTNEQMAALLIVADQYDLNPFVREIYAFPDKTGGISPIVSVDGWIKIINRQPEMDGLEFVEPDERVDVQHTDKKCPPWIEVHLFKKDWGRPVKIREYLEECYRPPFEGIGRDGKPYRVDGAWQSHPKRMLRHKALIQAARIAFGFSGIYDEDEPANVQEIQTQAQEIAFDVDIQPERPAIAWQDRIDEMASFRQWKHSDESLQEFITQTAKIHNVSRGDLVSQIAEREDDFWNAAENWCSSFDKARKRTTEESSTVAPPPPTKKPTPIDVQKTHPDRDIPAKSPALRATPGQVGMFDDGPKQWDEGGSIEDVWAALEEIYPDVYDQLDQAGYNPNTVVKHWLSLGLHRLPDELKTALAMALGSPNEFKAHLNQIGVGYSEQQ